MPTRRFAFVIVGFEAEFWLLRLQAQSMARYLPVALVHEIVVIDNSVDGMPPDVTRGLLDDYGDLTGLVRILRPQEICPVPGAIGWRSQQVLKLCVAELLTCDRYVVLDAKNLFVATLEPGFLEASDGRARVIVYGYETHPMRPALEHVLTYLGLDPSRYVPGFTATVTPFVLDTATVKALIRDIERSSGRSFAQEFVARGLTEFFLYSGWIASKGRSLEEVFDFHKVSCPTVWPHAANLEGVREAIRLARERGTPVFSVQRNALARLDAASVAELASFWVERDLFPSAAEAVLAIADFQHAYVRQARTQRIRELPYRLRTRSRRAARKVLRFISRRARSA